MIETLAYISVAILGPGAVIVFMWFLIDLDRLLKTPPKRD